MNNLAKITIPSWLIISIAYLSGLAIPLSTALQNLTIALICIIGLIDQNIRSKIKVLLTNYFVLASLFLYILLLIGSFKSTASINEICHMLVKMRVFLLCPLILATCSDLRFRIGAIYGFLIGAVITFLVSYGMYIFHKPLFSASINHWSSTIGDWAAFRYHTYHNYFLAIAVAGLLSIMLYYKQQLSAKIRLGMSLIIILATVDILYLVQGRAGQLLFFIIIALIFLLWNIKRGLIFCGLLAIMAVGIIYTSTAVKNGLARMESDVTQYSAGNPDTSVGLRLEFRKYSMELIKKSPIIGYGTGSFPEVYKKYTGFSGSRATRHPHNDFLWLWIELGILGVVSLALIILNLSYLAIKQRSPESKLLLAITISYFIGAWQGGFFTDNISSSAFMLISCVLLSGNTFNYLILLRDKGIIANAN